MYEKYDAKYGYIYIQEGDPDRIVYEMLMEMIFPL